MFVLDPVKTRFPVVSALLDQFKFILQPSTAIIWILVQVYYTCTAPVAGKSTTAAAAAIVTGSKL